MIDKEKVKQAENKGRDIFFEAVSGKARVEFSQEQFAPTDGKLTAHTTCVFEIKHRDIPSTKYEKEGFIFEKKKYDDLEFERSLNHLDKSLYICIFQDCIIAWDVANLGLTSDKWKIMNCTAHTLEGYKKGEKPKEITLLDKKDALWILKRN